MSAAKMFNVAGKTTVVTGGATGLGLAFVEVMAAGGARVTMLDLDEEALSRGERRLRGEGLDVSGVRADVTDPQAVEAAFAAAAAKGGSLDVVFVNAGIDPGPGWLSTKGERLAEHALENYPDSRWHSVIRISLDAVFFAVRAAARHMRPQRSGRIIVVTSIAALRPSPNAGAAYAAAKSGAAHVVRAFAQELAPDNILVNAIAPGPFATGMVVNLLGQDGVRERGRNMPLGRLGDPEEIKGLALYLASPASSYVTGQQFVIDGGVSLGAVRP